MGNYFIKLFIGIRHNDITNAFKCYRKEVIKGVEPLFSNHFNLTVELPLKAVIRGYKFATIPIRWTNRAEGMSKFKIKEMGSRYLFIIFYCFLEKHLSRGDYSRRRSNA
jgi:dolichol-phosphate mannosyltransferase